MRVQNRGDPVDLLSGERWRSGYGLGDGAYDLLFFNLPPQLCHFFGVVFVANRHSKFAS